MQGEEGDTDFENVVVLDAIVVVVVVVGSVIMKDCLVIFLISLMSSLASELVSYMLIYRTPHYQDLKARIDQLKKKREIRSVG